MKDGVPGQFDVLVDGDVIASRKRTFLTLVLGGGWPDEEAVVSEIQRRAVASS